MDEYHHVSGFFAHREEAESTFSRLVERGLPCQAFPRLSIKSIWAWWGLARLDDLRW